MKEDEKAEPQTGDSDETDNPEKTEGKKEEKPESIVLKAGSWIGYLERIIVVALIILNAPTAIGFVLTAKSIARFKKMDEPTFAERYLVGTLLSVGTAILAALLIKKVYPFV